MAMVAVYTRFVDRDARPHATKHWTNCEWAWSRAINMNNRPIAKFSNPQLFLNTCSQVLIVNFSVLVACLTGLRCPLFDFLLYHSRMKILTNFLIGVIH